LILPEELKKNVLEGFDPLLVVGELIDKHFEIITEHTFNFDPKKGDTEPQYILKLKELMQNMIGEIIDELKDGFEGEMVDVNTFLKANLEDTMKKNGDPTMVPMIPMALG